MNKLNKIFAVSALTLALSACNNGGDTLFNLEGGVTISGEELSSQTLTATVEDADGFNESNISYQWLADGVAIAGATSSSYILTDDELGSTITVSVNYTDDNNNDEAVISDATGVIEAIPVNSTGTVEITGDAKSGVELTATLTDENGLPTEGITYAWLAGEDSIGTESTVTLTNNEIGKTITVTVTYTDEDNFNESITSEATIVVTPENPNTLGTISITGTVASGAALTAEITDANGIPADGVTYEWLATDSSGTAAAIGDGTSTVILGDTEIGKTVTVTASYTDNDTYSESVLSEATAAVTGEVSAAATFSGDLTAETNSKESEAITGTAIVTDTIASEEVFVAITDFPATFGTFSITTTGAWTYTLDTANASVDLLAPTDTDLTDSITLTSDDGTETQLVITIVPGVLVPNNFATITDAADDSLGQLRVALADAGLASDVVIEDGSTIAAVESGKMTFSFNAEDIGDSSYFAIYGIRTNLPRALLEFRIKDDGKLFIRTSDEVELSQTYVEGEWVDVELTWDTSLATDSVAPIITLSVDGIPVTSADGTTITAGTFTSFTSDEETVQYGVTNIKYVVGTSSEIVTGQLSIDDIKIYHDIAGTTTPLAFEQDFETSAPGAIDPTIDSSIYHSNTNSTVVETITVAEVAPEPEA